MYEVILPAFPLILGFLMGSGIQQAFRTVFQFLFQVKEAVNQVFSTALVIRDSGVLMVQETYETAVMLIRNILDGVLVPILNATKEVMLLFKPALQVVVVILKTLILVLHRASELIILIVESVSAMLTSIFTTIHMFATNTSATVSGWTKWIYEGSSSTFFYTLLYLVGFYLLAQIIILFTKRLMKKIK